MENQTQATEATEPVDEMLDLEPWARPVVTKYGRHMFAMVMNAGLAGQAVQVLGQQAQKHHSKQMAKALETVSAAFNQLANAYCSERGWDTGMLAQCDRDIRLAFAGRIAVAGPGSSIILNG